MTYAARGAAMLKTARKDKMENRMAVFIFNLGRRMVEFEEDLDVLWRSLADNDEVEIF